MFPPALSSSFSHKGAEGVGGVGVERGVKTSPINNLPIPLEGSGAFHTHTKPPTSTESQTH